MTAPEARGDPFAGTPYEGGPEGWWTSRGGALNVTSGVVHFPPGSRPPPCRVPECPRCERRRNGENGNATR